MPKPKPLVVLRTAKQRSIADMLTANPGITNSAIARQLDVALSTVQRVRDYIRAHPSKYKRGVPTPISVKEIRAEVAAEFVSDEQNQESYRGWLKANLPVRRRAELRAKAAEMVEKQPAAALKALDWIDEMTNMAPKPAAENPIPPPLFQLSDGSTLRIDFGQPGLKRVADDPGQQQHVEKKGIVLEDARTLSSLQLDPRPIPPPTPLGPGRQAAAQAGASGQAPLVNDGGVSPGAQAPAGNPPAPPARDSSASSGMGLVRTQTPAVPPSEDTHEEEC